MTLFLAKMFPAKRSKKPKKIGIAKLGYKARKPNNNPSTRGKQMK